MATKHQTAELSPVADLVIKYDVTEEAIADLQAKFEHVTFDTPAAYEEGRKAIAQLRGLRTAIEKRRVELKADSLAWGRKVDATARQLTAAVEAVEAPLIEAKSAVDEAEARAKREAERAELLAIEERTRQEAAAAEEKLRAEREALAAEQARRDEENRAIAEQQRIERERLAAERAAIEAKEREVREKEQAAARVERERVAAEQARERDRLAAEEAERRAREEAEAAAAMAARVEALKPDVEKLRDFAARIRQVAADYMPQLESPETRGAAEWAAGKLGWIAGALEGFKLKGATAPRSDIT